MTIFQRETHKIRQGFCFLPLFLALCCLLSLCPEMTAAAQESYSNIPRSNSKDEYVWIVEICTAPRESSQSFPFVPTANMRDLPPFLRRRKNGVTCGMELPCTTATIPAARKATIPIPMVPVWPFSPIPNTISLSAYTKTILWNRFVSSPTGPKTPQATTA